MSVPSHTRLCAIPLPLFRSALVPPLPMLGFVLRGSFFFSEWAVDLGRVSPLKGETDGIQTTVLLTFRGNSNTLIRLGHSFGLVVV